MLVLGIESSCDETAAAVVRDGREILSSVVHSQVREHAAFGGVVPEIAARNHLMWLPPLVREALARAKISHGDLACIAVTRGPGLIGALLTGVQFAKGLSLAWNCPLVGVNHLEGHLAAARLEHPDIEPPFIGLVVSGGHTSLYRAREWGEYDLLGSTRDDAAGEAFDKVAKVCGLGYPGGAVVDRLARQGDPARVKFRRPMPGKDNLEFSFSGLKTAVITRIGEMGGVPAGDELNHLLAGFQDAAAGALVKKTLAAARITGLKTAVVSGGVACNSRLRELMLAGADKSGVRVIFPSPALCADNAAMIAAAGSIAFERGRRDTLSMAAAARLPLEYRPAAGSGLA
ncbi:MAG: tRNA N6-adenosine threonylcarbamoyltransferase [Myxococcota bacterium]|nr:tRNA N6-adenosine threonylcarbamoyltransferase [Myxococcota bacterium]